MKQLLTVLFIYTVYTGFAQVNDDDYKKYFPQDLLYEKLGVKAELNIVSQPFEKKVFDKHGRIIEKYRFNDTIRTCYKYINKGDSLVRFEYLIEKGVAKQPYRFEIFVYNSIRKIRSYKIFTPSSNFYNQKTDCNKDTFIYDSGGRILSKCSYYIRNYNKSFSKTITIQDNKLVMFDSMAYDYNSEINLLIINHLAGEVDFRKTDSIFYDEQNRMIKSISWQKRGYEGEIGVSDVIYMDKYHYQKNTTTIETYHAYSGFFNEPRLLKKLETLEYIFNSNGLKKTFGYSAEDLEKIRFGEYKYEFYGRK